MKASTSVQAKVSDRPFGFQSYGYQWWLGSARDDEHTPWMMAVGNGGQRIMLIPSRDLVMVMTAGMYNSPAPDGYHVRGSARRSLARGEVTPHHRGDVPARTARVSRTAGIVAFAIPIYWLISTSRTDLVRPLGLLPLLLGCAGLLWCVRDFYVFGKGTLAPWSPPERLVTAGLYRYSRNPMYVAVLLILLGWAASFGRVACIGTRSSWASRFTFASSSAKSRGCAARTTQHGMSTCVACAVGCKPRNMCPFRGSARRYCSSHWCSRYRPLWFLGAKYRIQILPGLPLSAIMVVCSLVASLLLTARERGRPGVVAHLARLFDYRNIVPKGWYLPILFLPPAIAILSYTLMRALGMPLPPVQLSLTSALVLFALFFISALCEESGWSGYLIDPLQGTLGRADGKPRPRKCLGGVALRASLAG